MGDISAHFDRGEFACKCGCGFDTVDTELLTMLEIVRQHFDEPVTINSGCRCVHRNKVVGGQPASMHLTGRAADIQVQGVAPSAVQGYVMMLWPDRYGIGSYSTFTHLDSRGTKARW